MAACLYCVKDIDAYHKCCAQDIEARLEKLLGLPWTADDGAFVLIDSLRITKNYFANSINGDGKTTQKSFGDKIHQKDWNILEDLCLQIIGAVQSGKTDELIQLDRYWVEVALDIKPRTSSSSTHSTDRELSS